MTASGEIHYLALGDSYTIGTAVGPATVQLQAWADVIWPRVKESWTSPT